MNKKLIPSLLVMYFKAKDLHYAYLEAGRKGDHAFMDRYTDDVMDFIDSIQEVANRSIYGDFMPSIDILKSASDRLEEFEKTSDIKELEKQLSDIIAECLDLCDEFARQRQRDTGTVNLLNGISQKLQQLYGFQPNESR